MIKVTVGEQEPQKKKDKYPRIMKSDETHYIVLFTNEKRGTVLFTRGILEVGQFHDSFNMDCFTDYNLPITLQNTTL